MNPRDIGKTRNVLSFRIGLLALFVVTQGLCAELPAQRRGTKPGRPPNIILILADDLGYRELGSYGQKKIKTPNIDRLAQEGMRFTQAYSGSAVCAPSRCVLMTGKHPGHAHVRDNANAPLPSDEPGVAKLLKQHGYQTAVFGKWGLGKLGSTGEPLKQGFDHFLGYLSQGRAHSYYPDYLIKDSGQFPLDNNPPVKGHAGFNPGDDVNDPRSYDRFKGQDYAPDRIFNHAVDFIKTNKDHPFFMYYASIIPHLALHIPDEYLAPYLALDWPEVPFTGRGEQAKGYHYTPHLTPKAAYAAMISRLDWYVGEIVKLLEKLGIADNTLIIFTSDNGTTFIEYEVCHEFFESVGELRGLKASVYEGGIRVPLIAHWPGRIKPGTVSDRVIGFEDMLPTLADAVGASDAPKLDGISFLPTLLSQKQPERAFLYREFRKKAVLRQGDWKGILSKRNQMELYNLTADPSESNDVSKQHPEMVANMLDLMKAQHAKPTVKKFRMPNLE